MRRQEDLQVKLRERQRRLLTANHYAYGPTIKVVVDMLRSDPLLTGILEEASRAEPGLDVEAFIDDVSNRHPDWVHTTEGGQATLIWELLQRLDDGRVNQNILWMLGGSTNLNESLRNVTENLIAPLFDYLVERVGDQSSILHAMERYVRVFEWFDREDLLTAYEADTQQGELIYNRHLRKFLFQEGIDLPFTEAQSPSGESDALANLSDEDPLVCEIKVFDGANRGVQHIATGVHQAWQYASDYGKGEAYLVVVNLSGQPLSVESDGTDRAWPPYLDISGIRIYIIVARGRRIASASKSGKAKPTVLSRAKLVDED